MSNKYKTVIVDDHPIVISGISGLLSDFNSVEITAKLTFKNATDSKSTNANIFGRVSADGNKIIEIKGH